MDSIERRIFEYLGTLTPKLPEPGPQAAALDYIEQGWLDSLGIVNLITFAEAEFGVTFSFEDMESPEFRTVAGLAGLVRKAEGA